MVVKGSLFILLGIVFLLLSIYFASAVDLNGTVMNITGSRLEGALINVTMRNTAGFTINHSNWTYTNSSGGFNLTLVNNDNWLYEPVITYNRTASGRIIVDAIGQNLPAFPQFVLNQLSSTIFYLRDAGTLNITAINSTGGRIAFNYIVKDTKLGYPIALNMGGDKTVQDAVIYVPTDRNYSIMIFPNSSMPVTFDWNNFSSINSIVVGSPSAGTNLSTYNATTKILHKQFNTTISITQVYGFVNASNASVFSGWTNLTIVPFLVEPGNNIHKSQGVMPWNMSSFINVNNSDNHTLATGFYNISISAPAETAQILLFATGRNGSNYFGGFGWINSTYGVVQNQTNISMYGLLGIVENITMSDASDFSKKVNITTMMQRFQLVNSSNLSLSSVDAHIEVSVDYSSLFRNVPKFTWVEFISQGSPTNFTIPLINTTNVNEINIFAGGGNYAPKRISPSISSLISNNNNNNNVSNITIAGFNPQAIDTAIQASQLTMNLFVSNSTCDVPYPADSCFVGGSASFGNKTMDQFNPMSAIMGGGKISFRMGSGGILVHYVNVDMLASGPPDALFDSSASSSSSGNNLDSAVRFGSLGPTVYDYILVSIPYTEGAGSGLDDSQSVNISIPLMYDDSWNVIWNTTANGSNVGALSSNFSHYSGRQNEWAYLINQTICGTNSSSLNSSNPCYLNTTTNRVWIRLPHFSGAGPTVKGTKLAAATTTSSSDGGDSGGGGIISWISTQKLTEQQFNEGIQKNLAVNYRVTFDVSGETHHIGVKSLTKVNATLEIASNPIIIVFNIGDVKKFDLDNNGFYESQVKLENIIADKAVVSVIKINEKVPESTGEVGESESGGENESEIGKKISKNVKWIFIVIGIIIIFIIFFLLKYQKKKRY